MTMDDFGGSVAGGGRYDKMIGKFTGQDTPACGFSIGFERIVMLLLENGYEVPTVKREEGISVREEDDKKRAFKGYVTCKDRPSGRKTGSDRQHEEE